MKRENDVMGQKHILVVEDNELNREMLVDILSDQYVIHEAENGQAALDFLNHSREEIALILLDMMMPVMDGYTFLKKIKAVPEHSLIPVIVMTQGDSEEDEVNALAHGATDFVPKPYRPQIILHRIKGLIDFRETAALANQFKYDHLTGLYSKEFFWQQLKEILLNNEEDEYDIVCCNIENFKLYNDAFGAANGDRLLCEIAEFLTEKVEEHELLSRFRADRFMWVKKSEYIYNEEVFTALDQQIRQLPGAGNLHMKWGIYKITDRSVPVEKMCDRVMLAVDSIKGKYLKHYVVYDDAMREKLLREQEIIEKMADSLEDHQFQIYLQPKICLHDGTLAGAEALVRWKHPEKGMISPGEFIPLFEKNGFITQMDQYVWEQTCVLIKEWKAKGYPVVPVSVNVSRADFYITDLTEYMDALVRKYDLQPSDLHLEVTESVYTENPIQILHMIEGLRSRGFVIELDDFGSGYSSLNMLNQMELDIMKLDMKFIQSEMMKPEDQGILRFIIDLAHSMKLSVVAEGIETGEQVERIKKLGCDYAQGYFFSRSVCVEEFEEILKKQM